MHKPYTNLYIIIDDILSICTNYVHGDKKMTKISIDLSTEDEQTLLKSFKGFNMAKNKALSLIVHSALKASIDDIHDVLCDQPIEHAEQPIKQLIKRKLGRNEIKLDNGEIIDHTDIRHPDYMSPDSRPFDGIQLTEAPDHITTYDPDHQYTLDELEQIEAQ